MKVIVLAAGMGARLGRPHPKPLTTLVHGRTIMDEQISGLLHYVPAEDICLVVGFEKQMIRAKFPHFAHVENSDFRTTNTSKSLLLGLREIGDCDVLWLNGDVVFDHHVIGRLIAETNSCMAVNTALVDEEEVKYHTDSDGTIANVSKELGDALGEAVGINKVSGRDVPLLMDCLEACHDRDYFEKALELAISRGLKLYPVDVSDLFCCEIDTEADLAMVNVKFAGSAQ